MGSTANDLCMMWRLGISFAEAMGVFVLVLYTQFHFLLLDRFWELVHI